MIQVYAVIADGQLMMKPNTSHRGYALFVSLTQALRCAQELRTPRLAYRTYPTATVYEMTASPTPVENVVYE